MEWLQLMQNKSRMLQEQEAKLQTLQASVCRLHASARHRSSRVEYAQQKLSERQRELDELRMELPGMLRNHQYSVGNIGQYVRSIDSNVSRLNSSCAHAAAQSDSGLGAASHALQIALKRGKDAAQLQAAVREALVQISEGRRELARVLASFQADVEPPMKAAKRLAVRLEASAHHMCVYDRDSQKYVDDVLE